MGSHPSADSQPPSSASHDVELTRGRDQETQHIHNERTHLIPKKPNNKSSDQQQLDQQQGADHAAAHINGLHTSDSSGNEPDTSVLHLPAPLNHVAEALQDEVQHVATATHEYIVKHHRGITTFLVAVTRILEQTDATLLPAVYIYVGCAFNATPAQLGSMTFTRLVVQAFASPLGGLLGHRYNRVLLVACACWYWALCTVLFAASSSTAQGMAIWAFNGIGLGVMVPNAQSLVADYYDATHRGRAFGMLLAVGNLGSMLSSAYATNIGGLTIMGMQGWRFAFITVALISAVAGIAMWAAARDPRCSRHTWQLDEHYRHTESSSSSQSRTAGSSSNDQHRYSDRTATTDHHAITGTTNSSREDISATNGTDQHGRDDLNRSKSAAAKVVRESESSSLLRGSAAGPAGPIERLQQFLQSDLARETWVVLSTPSFMVVVVQGFLGSMPWSAFAFTTLYLQLQGWTDAGASAIMALFSGADAVGAFLGGVVGDWAAARFPDHGRITACQFSVGIGVPLCLLIFQGLPMGSSTEGFLLYGVVFALMGLLISWAATACNNPIFAEIVPPHLRTLVYAFDRCLEGALSALGAPLVGVTAQRFFHFSGTAATQDCSSGAHRKRHEADFTKARALGDALTLFSTIPWTLCCLVYTLLHWTYPRDKRRGHCTGLPLQSAQFSPLPMADDAGVIGFRSAGDHVEGFSGPEMPITPGLLDRIDEYISQPRGGAGEVSEVELQEAGLVQRQ